MLHNANVRVEILSANRVFYIIPEMHFNKNTETKKTMSILKQDHQFEPISMTNSNTSRMTNFQVNTTEELYKFKKNPYYSHEYSDPYIFGFNQQDFIDGTSYKANSVRSINQKIKIKFEDVFRRFNVDQIFLQAETIIRKPDDDDDDDDDDGGGLIEELKKYKIIPIEVLPFLLCCSPFGTHNNNDVSRIVNNFIRNLEGSKMYENDDTGTFKRIVTQLTINLDKVFIYEKAKNKQIELKAVDIDKKMILQEVENKLLKPLKQEIKKLQNENHQLKRNLEEEEDTTFQFRKESIFIIKKMKLQLDKNHCNNHDHHCCH